MPTLGEDNPPEAEEPPITFEDGEEMPTLGETDPTQAETGPTKWEDIPTSDEENPTAQEETPTGQETTPTFREWEATQWEDFPTLPAGEEGKHWITDNPPQPLPPSTIWWENPPQHPFPGPFAPDQPGSNRQQGRWVVRNGRWVFVRSGGGKKSPFGGRHR